MKSFRFIYFHLSFRCFPLQSLFTPLFRIPVHCFSIFIFSFILFQPIWNFIPPFILNWRTHIKILPKINRLKPICVFLLNLTNLCLHNASIPCNFIFLLLLLWTNVCVHANSFNLNILRQYIDVDILRLNNWEKCGTPETIDFPWLFVFHYFPFISLLLRLSSFIAGIVFFYCIVVYCPERKIRNINVVDYIISRHKVTTNSEWIYREQKFHFNKTNLEIFHLQCDFVFVMVANGERMFLTWCHTRPDQTRPTKHGFVAFFDRLLLKSDEFINVLLDAFRYFCNLLQFKHIGRLNEKKNEKKYVVIRRLGEKFVEIFACILKSE